MSGIIEGLAVEGLWAGTVGLARGLLGSQIRITSPKTGGYLEDDPQPLGSSNTSYKVRGVLKRLPKGHEIWLLRQDELSSQIWPQGFSRVVFDPETRQWHGRVNGTGSPTFKVIAVVAPPTSQDYFKFFQSVGGKTKHYEPIERVPPECRNQHFVQARTK